MSLLRVGLSETKDFAEGYEAIFGKKAEAKKEEPKVEEGPKPTSEKADPPANPFRKGEGIGC